jgi:hypothetical protein
VSNRGARFLRTHVEPDPGSSTPSGDPADPDDPAPFARHPSTRMLVDAARLDESRFRVPPDGRRRNASRAWRSSHEACRRMHAQARRAAHDAARRPVRVVARIGRRPTLAHPEFCVYSTEAAARGRATPERTT